jgi:hypothetical protein
LRLVNQPKFNFRKPWLVAGKQADVVAGVLQLLSLSDTAQDNCGA